MCVHVTYLCSLVYCTLTSVMLLAKVHEVVTTTNRMIKEKLPSILRSMSLYLANDETEHILFRPIKVQPPCYSILRYNNCIGPFVLPIVQCV